MALAECFKIKMDFLDTKNEVLPQCVTLYFQTWQVYYKRIVITSKELLETLGLLTSE